VRVRTRPPFNAVTVRTSRPGPGSRFRIQSRSVARAYVVTGATGAVERLLVPLSGDVDVDRALSFVVDLVSGRDIGVTLLYAGDADAEEARARLDAGREQLAGAGIGTRTEYVTDAGPFEALVDAVVGHDAVVMANRRRRSGRWCSARRPTASLPSPSGRCSSSGGTDDGIDRGTDEVGSGRSRSRRRSTRGEHWAPPETEGTPRALYSRSANTESSRTTAVTSSRVNELVETVRRATVAARMMYVVRMTNGVSATVYVARTYTESGGTPKRGTSGNILASSASNAYETKTIAGSEVKRSVRDRSASS
jgi:hypothetical protein